VRLLLATPVLLAALVLAAGCGGRSAATVPRPVVPRIATPVLPADMTRDPLAKTDQDSNPANLASAVITYSFGQLPEYIDGASLRLLPHDVAQTSEPGVTTRHVYRITVPEVNLVLDTVYTAAPESEEAHQLARDWTIDVTLDGRHVIDPDRFWVFYRNNGPQICRIYFPGDLGSLQMGANSMYFYALKPGRHRLVVRLEQNLGPDVAPARLIADYRLRVLDRPPNAHERALAPDEDAPPPASNRTPLSFRTQSSS
jgi:hypothetical protein